MQEPKCDPTTFPYMPDAGSAVIENPPRFAWLTPKTDEQYYVLQVAANRNFDHGLVKQYAPLEYSFFTPEQSFEPGVYYWRYAVSDGAYADSESSASSLDWSSVREFKVPEHLPLTPLLSRSVRYDRLGMDHPRLWLQTEGILRFREQLQQDAGYCGFSDFYTGSVLPWVSSPIIREPELYPDNKRTVELWRQSYKACQDTLNAVRNLSIAGVLLRDHSMIERAKAWLLEAAGWDTEGATSRDYNDEAAFRIAAALAWGYDWLHAYLTHAERSAVRRSLLRRTEQVALQVRMEREIHRHPFDSHAVRSLSSVLVPCCLALLDEEEQAKAWLDYTLEFFSALYTPWGGSDGGWAEGGTYWTTGQAFLIDALGLIKDYMGIDFWKRPFFQKTGDFPLYCFSAGTSRASFGDQSNLGLPPGLKTAYNARHYAGVTGNGYYQWYYETVKAQDVGTGEEHYNSGWWDFRFDELLHRHRWPTVTAEAPADIPLVKWFRDIGWVAMHHRMDCREEHIMLLAKSSRYGSVSHSHGDQNSFVLHAYGEPLIIASGEYVAFGSSMHLNWRRQTRSTNSLLINGHGQYAGKDIALNLQACGTVEEAYELENCGYARLNATEAYKLHVPDLKRNVREIYFINRSCFIIVDSIDMEHPAAVEWLLHACHSLETNDHTFTISGLQAELEGQFVYCSSGSLQLSLTDQYIDVDPAELEGAGKQWHMTALTAPAASHRIITLLVPKRKGQLSSVTASIVEKEQAIEVRVSCGGHTELITVDHSCADRRQSNVPL